MLVVFRVDASFEIGTGHVMRCLTLADEITARGAECRFICREHTGNMIDYIRNKNYITYALPVCSAVDKDLAHSQWLKATQIADAQACTTILEELNPDWLINDHYALDFRWEMALAPFHHKGMVIDDLADRRHECHLLLDQTLGRDTTEYQPLVPRNCNLLCGSIYALLRPDFAALREYSLRKRSTPQLKHVLISMGGVDKDNVTSQVMEALRSCHLPHNSEITVVMGIKAPWLTQVQQRALMMPWPTMVRTGVSNMAELMADTDLAIGAAGATSWERCCLGVPTYMVILAENQRGIARALAEVGAAVILETENFHQQIGNLIAHAHTDSMKRITKAAATVTDGLGAKRVVDTLFAEA